MSSSLLLVDILNCQVASKLASSISHERFRSVIQGSEVFSREEEILLWSAPMVRQNFFLAREECLCEVNEFLEENEMNFAFAHAAATNDSIVFRGEGFEVLCMLFTDLNEWHLSVKLAPEVQGELFCGSEVVIFDQKTSKVWVKGVPDSWGEINTVWPIQDKEPSNYLSDSHLLLVVK